MKILLTDEHILFREGIKYFLKNIYPGVEILEASNSSQTLEIISRVTGIDLILIDLHMSDKRNISALKNIVSSAPNSLVVILTTSKRNSDITIALQLGVVGYITKCVLPNIMKNAINTVLAGHIYVPKSHQKPGTTIKRQRKRIDDLTPRQSEILKFIVDGNSNKQLANNLGLTLSTVKTHISAIFKVLNVKNRTQAAMHARATETSWVN